MPKRTQNSDITHTKSRNTSQRYRATMSRQTMKILLWCGYAVHLSHMLQVRPVLPRTVSKTQLDLERRQLFQATAASLLSTSLLPSAANAGSLLQFPVTPEIPLKNKYHLMRAGPSELEMEGIYSTNPLFLTNRENAMHPSGERIIRKSLEVIRQQPPTVAFHSLAANGMDTGDLIARELRLGRDRLLPEFTYLDQRGVGLWDSSDESLVKPAVWALDHQEAGLRGMDGRPPAKDDGTPNETLNDQFIRLRQFLSLQESRTAGDIILIIFPDGTGPALLSCMIAGIPYKDVHALEFEPGEVRLDVTPESIRQLYEERKEDPKYLETLEKGKEQLVTLRQQNGMVSLKELREQKVQEDMDLALKQKKQAEAERDAQRKLEQAERQKALQMEYEEKARLQKEEKERIKAEAAAKKAAELAKRSESYRSSTKPTESKSVASKATSSNTSESDSKNGGMLSTVGLGVVGLAVGALGIIGSNGADDDVSSQTTTPTPPAPTESESKETDDTVEASVLDASVLDAVEETTVIVAEDDQSLLDLVARHAELDETEEETIETDDDSILPLDLAEIQAESETSMEERTQEEVEREMELPLPVEENGLKVENVLNDLASAEQAMKDALAEAGERQQPSPKKGLYDSPVPTAQAPVIMDEDDFDDDGAGDWLRVLAEIRDEDEDDDDDDALLVNGSSDAFDANL